MEPLSELGSESWRPQFTTLQPDLLRKEIWQINPPRNSNRSEKQAGCVSLTKYRKPSLCSQQQEGRPRHPGRWSRNPGLLLPPSRSKMAPPYPWVSLSKTPGVQDIIQNHWPRQELGKSQREEEQNNEQTPNQNDDAVGINVQGYLVWATVKSSSGYSNWNEKLKGFA